MEPIAAIPTSFTLPGAARVASSRGPCNPPRRWRPRTSTPSATLLLALALATPSPAQGATADLRAEVDAYFAPLVEAGIFAGTVLVARGGSVLVHAGYGLAHAGDGVANTADTRFKLMSVSKAITAVAVLRLVQDGKLRLTDPVGRHLGGWPQSWQEVTVHDLLDHTSGIPNLEQDWVVAARAAGVRGLAAWKRLAPRLGDRPLSAPPGTQCRYSNFNFELAGAVLEAASGRSFREQAAATVLAPAQMEQTGFDDGSRFPELALGYFAGRDGGPEPRAQDMSVIQAAGGFWSTAGDLYRLDRALRAGAVLDAQTHQVMVTPRTGSYACGWDTSPVHGHPCFQHSGGANGYVADFLRFPEDDACVVVLSNFAFAPILRVSHDLAAILFGTAYDQPRAVAPSVLDSCAGVYPRRGGGALVVRRFAGALLVFAVDPGAQRCAGDLLVPIGETTFAPAMGEGRLVFEPARGDQPARVRERRAARDEVLVRAEPAPDSWADAVGELAAEPALGSRVRITEDAAGLALRIDGGWPTELALVPVDAALALALYDAAGGTLLHREGEVLRWQRADGMEFRLRRR